MWVVLIIEAAPKMFPSLIFFDENLKKWRVFLWKTFLFYIQQNGCTDLKISTFND